MSLGRHTWSYRFLSWGLGITFLWIGVDILRHPDVWIGYVPEALPFGVSRELALRGNGVFDAALGIVLIMQWFPRASALLAALHLAGILISQKIDAVIIRDVGLLGAALALFFWPRHYRRSWHLFRRRKAQSGE